MGEMRDVLGFKLPKTFTVLNLGYLTVDKLHSGSPSLVF